MSKLSSSKTSRTDWPRAKTMQEEDITLTDEHPASEVNHIVRGIVRRGLRPIPPKASISLRVDVDVLEWFKAQGAGYQTRMNAVLRAFKDASSCVNSWADIPVRPYRGYGTTLRQFYRANRSLPSFRRKPE